MRQSITCVDFQDLEKTLGTLQSYLHSGLSISKPFPVAGEGAEDAFVRVRIRVENTAPWRGDSGQVVFVGVGLTITCAGDEELFRRLNSLLLPFAIRKWEPVEERRVVCDNAVFGQEGMDDSCVGSGPVGGATLFPGETTTFDIELPADSLPVVSIKVTGTVSPGNLFQFGHVLKSFDEWQASALAGVAAH